MVEPNYGFRRRLSVVHRPDRRTLGSVTLGSEALGSKALGSGAPGGAAPELASSASHALVDDGWSILIPRSASALVLTTAQDLQDYFLTSMGVSVLLRRVVDVAAAAAGGERCIVLATAQELPALGAGLSKARSYRLLCSAGRIVVCGHDERGTAQGSYYLEDLMNRREAPVVAPQDVVREPLFSPRMVHSGWGLDTYPDEHLNAMAHTGIDAILLFVGHWRDAVPVIDRTPKGYQDFNHLIDRAERYGIDVYAYSYLKSEKHPDEPDAEAYYESTYGALFQHCPRFKGVILVGESVEFPSKDPQTTGRSHRELSPDGVPPPSPAPAGGRALTIRSG